MARKNKHNASVAAAVSVSIFAFSGGAQAAPSGGNVIKGTAGITQSGTQTLIDQSTAKAVINWNDFSIDPGELVKFQQQMGKTSVTLNRVTGANVSQIKGALQANGNIFLINPNGIVFGATATVDVAGLLASTFDIDPDKFMNGDPLTLTGDMMSGASISNAGELKVGDGGFVYLIAPNVENTGHIIANVGSVTLASDGSYQVDLAGNGLIKFSVDANNLDGASNTITNSGVIDGGGSNAAQNVLLSGSQASAVVSSVVNTGNIKAATSLTLSGSSVDNHAGTLELNVQSGDSHDQITLQSDSPAQSGTVDFQDTGLSTSGHVEGTIKVTNSTGGVTLDNADVSGDLSVTAAGNIVGAGNAGGDAKADHLSLSTSTEGASVGTEGNALRVDADTLSASTNKGHIVVSDTSGDLALDNVTTGDTSADAGLRAIIIAEDGDLTGVAGAEPNVQAWAANLKADGNIGGAGQAVTTHVQVLSASTQDGGIHIDDSGDDLVLNTISAGERVTLDGKTVSIGATSNADGDVTLANGAVGSHDVSISADQDILITNGVTATGDLSIESRNGSLYQSGGSALLTGREIDLSAGGGIGQISSGALKTQSNEINAAAADGGVYLQEAQGLNIGELSAAGEDNNVELSASQGDIRLHHVKAEGGSVTVSTNQGAITGDGSSLNVEAGSLTLDASKNIGTSGANLNTKVGNLTTVSGTNLAGTYVANQGPLARLDVTTLDGDVVIRDTQNSGSLTFTGSNDELALSGSVQTDALDFTNSGGGLNVNGMDLSGQDVVLTASGAINSQNGVLKAFQATLSAEHGIDMETHVDQLDARTRHGDIDIDNSAYTGTLTATAEADDGDVTLTQGGDLNVDDITASGDVSLSADGAVTGVTEGTDVNATNLTVSGNGIGSASDAFATEVGGELSASAGSGALFLANVGSLTLLSGEAGGDIDLSVTGDAILDTLKSGGDVVFSAGGRVSDGNGNDRNIQAGTLTMEAEQIGARDGVVDALEMKVDQLVLDTSNGGIFVSNTNGARLTLTHAKAAGGDVSVATDGDLDLNTASAAGNKVTLTSGGAINDARPDGSSDANVLAKDLDMQAQDGVGNTGPLSLDVDHLSVGGGSGSVNAANLGAVAVDSDSLVGKGTGGVTIVATTITILDDNGGVITVNGGSLTLTATNGNIVFLNQDDTIALSGGGSIVLTAKADPEHQGYNGNIISGNLTTDHGGDITLDADANVTLGMLDTGGKGDVSVTARNGVILDGNGADQNIRGDHVTLIANTPTLNDAEINRETAISDYAARLAELNANTLQLENLQQQLDSYIAALKAAIVAKGIAQTQEGSAQREVDSLQRQLDAAQARDNMLNTALNIAGVARNAVAIAAGAAQSVPFSGDAGADATFAVVDLAFSVAQTALDSYERYTLDPLADNVNGKQIDLATLKANTQDAITSVETYTNLRNALQASVDNTTQAVFNTQVASDASEALRKQSINAYNQNQDIDMSASNPLGIQANQLDMGTSSGRALNSDVYLTSDGNLGLGDINADGLISAKGVAGDISVVGDVVSPSLITLQADGAVRGIGGTWVGGVWTPGAAGTLHAPTVALRAGDGIATSDDSLHTDTHEIAADGGDGDLYIENDNGGDELVLGTVDGVSGLKADGDLGLANNGDLRLKTQVVDTDTDSDNSAYLVADGGDIIDDNGATLNVTAHDLYFQAGGNVELDTDVDRVVDGESTDQGDITLRNLGDLDIVDLATGDGDMDVSATGGMVLETLAAGGVDGDITLDAQGNVDDDQDNDTRVSGNDLTITATGSIGATGDDDLRALDTSVDSLTADAGGEVNVDDSDNLDVTHLATNTGDVTLTSQSGSLYLGDVRTDGDGNTITVQAAGAIDALNDADDTAELHGSNLALRAGSGIGRDDQSLLVETGALEADAGTGGLYLTDRNNDLTVGGVTPNLGLAALSGLDADGDIRVDVTDGGLTVNEDVTQTGTGDTDLYSSGDMIVDAGMQAAGDMEMQSGGDLTVNGQTLTADGNLIGLAGGDVTLAANSQIDAGYGLALAAFGALSATDSTLNSGTAAAPGSSDIADLVLLTQNGDITLTNTTGTAAGGIQVGAGNGFPGIHTFTSAPVTPPANVMLTNTSLDAQSDDLALAATGDITLTQASSATAAQDLSASAGGDITLEQSSSLTATAGGIDAHAGNGVSFTDSSASAGTDLSMTAATDVRLDTSSADAISGDLSLTGTAGDVTLTDSSASADQNLDFTAGNGVALDHSSADAANATLAMTARNGDVALSNDSETSAGTTLDLTASHTVSLTDSDAISGDDMTLTGTAGDITVTNGETVTGGILDAHAGDNITLTDALAISGDHDPADPAPAQEDAGMTLTADQGDITLTRSQARSGGDLTGKAGVNIGLTDSDATAAGNATLTAGTDKDHGAGADIALDNSHVTANGGDAALTAADSISLQRASTLVAHNDLSADAQTGDLTLIQNSSLAAQNGQMDLDAGNAVAFTDSSASAAQSMTIDASDAGITLANSHATAGTDLSLDAGTDITLTHSADPATTGSTLVASTGDLSLTAGDNVALDSASSGVALGDVTANAESGDLTVIEQSKLLAETGKMDLDAGNRVSVTDSTLGAATDMTVDAADADIALDNSHATAGDNLAFTAGTDVTLVNNSHADATTGNLAMTGIDGDVALTDSVTNAHGTLDLSAGENVGLTRSTATAGGDMTLTGTAGDVTLALSQVTSGADLAGKAGQNLGLTDSNATAAGNVTLAAGSDKDQGSGADLTLDNSHVNANGGDVTLTAADSIGLQGASTVVARDNLSADAQAGDLTLIENSLLNARTGYMDLDAGQGVAITDSTLITATDLTVDADGADIAFDNSHATAQSGNATLTAADGISLRRASTLVAHGDLSADAQAGDLTLIQNSSLAAQTGQMDLDAGNAVSFTDSSATAATAMTMDAADAGITLANSHATAGTDLSLDAGTDITLTHSADLNTAGSTLSAQTGDLSLNAGNNIALDSASSGFASGDVTANADTGDLTVIEQSSLTAATGKMDLDAGKRIAVSNSVLSAATDLTMDAAAADIDLDHATATAGNDLSMTAATDVALTDSSAETTSGDLSLTGTAGDVTLTDSTASADQNLGFTAGNGVALDHSSADAANATVAMTARNGDVALSNDSETSAGTTLDLSASHTVSLTDSDATSGDDMTLTGTAGDIALANSHATAGTDLSLDAGTDITLTDSADPATTGSTLVASTGNLSLTAGDNIALDSASHGTGHGDVTANAEQGDLTVIEHSTLLAETGKMDLHAGSRVALTSSDADAGAAITVIADAADILLDDSNVTAATDLSLDAGGNITLTDTSGDADNIGSTITAQAGDLGLTAGSDIRLDSASHGTGHVDVTAHAKTGDLTVIERSTLLAQTGEMDLDAGQGVRIADSTLEAATNMTVDATGADIALDNSHASAGNDLSLTAGTDVSLLDTAVDATAGVLAITANDGAITQSGSSTAVSAGDMVLAASDGVAVTDLTSGADLTVTGGQGGIDMAAGSLASAAGDLTMTTDGDINLTRAEAAGDVTLTSHDGGINASGAVSENVTGQNLFLSTAKGIGSALSELKTKVGNLYATITGSGDLYLDEADALTVKDAQLADGDAHISTGGDLIIDRLAVNGDAVLDSAGVLSTGATGSVSAGDLTATAVDGIDLNADLASASLDVTGSGDLDLNNTGALTVNRATTTDGDIQVDAGGNLNIGQISAPGAHRVALSSDGAINAAGAGRIDGRDVALSASTGIGDQGPLSLNAATLTARSDNGDINLDQTGDVALNQVITGQGAIQVLVNGGDATLGAIRAEGNVSLDAADGSLRDDHDDATDVGGDTVTLASASGLGEQTRAIATQATRVNANVSGEGDINLSERDGLAGLNARASNGDIRVSTATGDLTVGQVAALSPGNAVMLFATSGSILDGNADANNIVASLLEIAAAQGIARASDPLDVTVDTLSADGGNGGVYINNGSSDPLDILALRGAGDLVLNTGGILDLSGALDGRSVAVHAGGDVNQHGDIQGANGVSVSGGGNVTMDRGTHTTSQGPIRYQAGNVLTVASLATMTGLDGSRITLQGHKLESSEPGAGSIRGGQVQVLVPRVTAARVHHMVDTTHGKARVYLNGRTLGGKISEDSAYVRDLVAPPGVFPTTVYQGLHTVSSLGFQKDDDSEEWHYNP